MRTVLLGAPGSGKGTQGAMLADTFGIPQVSTGDLLRAAVAAESDLGKKAKNAMDTGSLVSDEIVIGLIEERISQTDAQKGYILDGFPRNITQAEALDGMLEQLGQPLQAVVFLDVPFEELMQRLTGRRTCSSCGAIYNVHLSPPKKEAHCDNCNGELFQRDDDNESTIENRLQTYQQQTSPLIGFYSEQQKLQTVSAMGDINQIAEKIGTIFNQI